MTLIGASALKHLSKQEIRVLLAIEAGMRHSEYVEIDIIAKYAGYPISETEKWLQKCHKLDLIHRWSGHFIGYELTIHGYDTLALNALYEKGQIRSIGREKGVGKESIVYFALNAEGEEVILKMHRVGYTSFHQVKKKRRYTANKHHISELYASRLSAEAEIKWLREAYNNNLPVPKIIDSNRHIIVMELIDGIDLVKLNDIPNPIETLDIVIDFVKNAWKEGEFVHGDLSEHNIIMRHDDTKPIIIDFPQAVHNKNKEAEKLLERDIRNIITFFKRKYGLNMELGEVIDYVKN